MKMAINWSASKKRKGIFPEKDALCCAFCAYNSSFIFLVVPACQWLGVT